MALSDFLSRHGVSRTATGSMVMAGAAQVLEVGLATGAVGALEQRYGEEKTTLFMTAQTNADGSPATNPDGSVAKKSGTGIPMSAAGAIIGIAASALLPMSATARRHLLNVSSGFASAWTYRKGIEMGQKWLDSKQSTNPNTQKPLPPYAQSAFAQSEIANVKGEMGEPSNVYSLVEQANQVLKARAAAGGR